MNTNTFPYYDDFLPNKKFYQVLFKPGYSAQARELTQLQSILQNQIKEFGDSVFKQGTVITGCAESHNFKTPYVKIRDIDVSVYPLSYYEGMTVTSQNGVSAVIKKTYAGKEAEAPFLNTLYLHYISSNVTDPDPLLVNTISTFLPNQVLTIVGNNNGVSTFNTSLVNPTGEGSLFSLNDGIVYANGRFLVHSNQTIVIDRYSSTPTQKVGFRVIEEIVTTYDDSTLNDPSQGSFNFNAPGGDRYKISTLLTSYAAPEIKPEDFFLLFEIENGIIKRRFDKTQYSELGREFARRTYDESGDYAVRPFPVIVNEHLNDGSNHGKYSAPFGDAGKLVIGVEAGKAYVRGYEQELFSTEFLEIMKAYSTTIIQNQNVSLGYGNYIRVKKVAGLWPLNSGELVQISSNNINAVSGTTYSSPADPGGHIGTARVRNIEYESGTIGTENAIYRLYLFDVNLSAGSVGAIKSFYLDDGSSNFSYADVSGTPSFIDTKFSSPIFPLTHKNPKTLTDSSYVYKKTFTQPATGGTFAVSLGVGEEWSFGPLLTDTLIQENIKVTLDDVGTGLGATGRVFDFTATGPANPFVTFTSSTTLSFDFGSGFTVGGSPTVNVVVSVRKSLATADAKTVKRNRYVKIQTSSEGPFCLGFHDVMSIEKIWTATGPVAYPTAEPLITDAIWTDNTDWFKLNNGQSDTMYNLATISKTPVAGTVSGLYLIVKLSYFDHASSGGFYSVDSYDTPVENEAATTNQIYLHEIPSYTTTTGIIYNLRDVLDFRSTVVNTAADTTSIAGATIDPSSGVVFGASITTPVPHESFITDITYYLPRSDRVILDSAGTFKVVSGIPSENPVTPRQTDNSMTLAIVNVPAFPSLSPYYARQLGKPEYATTITFVDNRRFTMRDIGTIQRRVERLEKYASLSILEQQTSSMLIPDSYGVDRYKNGIVVDPFIGHNVGNVYNSDYACSIASGELRPFFKLDNVTFDVDSQSTGVVRKANDLSVVVQQSSIGSSNYTKGETVTSGGGGHATVRHFSTITADQTYRWFRLYLENVIGVFATGNTVTGDLSGATGSIPTSYIAGFPEMVKSPTEGLLVTLPYTHVVYSESPYATKSRNCSSLILFSFEGSMELSPSSDEWADTSVQPEILFNSDGMSDNWMTMTTAWGTQWENWKTIWQKFDSTIKSSSNGSINPSVLTTSQRQLRDGISLSALESDSVNVVPYMRSVVITFTASRLKANTAVFPFFDGVDVSAHCKPAGKEYGDSLSTDSFGSLIGEFRIPAETFTTGAKNFVVSDVSSDPLSVSSTTMAYASYTASGDKTFENNSILSTQHPETTFDYQRTTQNSVVDRQVSSGTVYNPTVDPIAQTFFVSNSSGGILLTKIGVYFKNKSLTSPITLQLREVLNGYPTENILPYSTVTLLPEDVNTSNDGSGVTEFSFPSPVYLKNDNEYAFVLLPTGNDTGYEVWVGELGKVDVGSTILVDKQPNAGTLYVAGNNRTWTPFINEDIKFTAFSGNFTGSGRLILHNLPMEYMTFSDLTTTFYPGDVITGTGLGTGIGTIQYFNYQTNEAEVLVTSGYFDISDTVSSALGTANTASATRSVDAISPSLSFLNFNNTEIDWSYKMYKFDGTTFNPAVNMGLTELAINGTTEFDEPMAIFSHSTYHASPVPLNSSMILQADITTRAANISPVIDLEKVACIIIGNSINNDITNEARASRGSALSKYITRTIVLDDGMEADDLQTFISAHLPSGSSIKVYAKLLSDIDLTPFEDRPWTEMEKTVISGNEKFTELHYKLPATTSSIYAPETGGLDTLIYTYIRSGVTYAHIKAFAVKIVLLSDKTTSIPIIRDMRTVALLA